MGLDIMLGVLGRVESRDQADDVSADLLGSPTVQRVPVYIIRHAVTEGPWWDQSSLVSPMSWLIAIPTLP